MAAFLLPWRITRYLHDVDNRFKIDLPLLCGALPGGRAVDGVLVALPSVEDSSSEKPDDGWRA